MTHLKVGDQAPFFKGITEKGLARVFYKKPDNSTCYCLWRFHSKSGANYQKRFKLFRNKTYSTYLF